MSHTQATSVATVEVKAEDLPLHCPNPTMQHWSSHPRVFLDVAHGPVSCPYCGTRYQLAAGAKLKAH